jgi:dihydrofolate synthase/folylpolyglutamate synthase
MLKDKDIPGVIAALKSQVAHWFIAGLGGARGAGVAELQQVFAAASITAVTACDDIAAAYTQACDIAAENDRIIVFGSFYTVAAVMQFRERQRASPASGGIRGNQGP